MKIIQNWPIRMVSSPSGQRQTSRLFAKLAEYGTVWLGCYTPPAVPN